MDRKKMNFAGMLQTLEEFLTANLSSFENNPNILSILDQLKIKNVDIRRLNLTQSESTEADYEIKSADEVTLIAIAEKVSDGLMVIAARTNDMRLKIDGKVTHWDLRNMRESNMYVRLKQLHVTALPFVDQLLPMGISTREVNLLNTDTSDLAKATPVIKVKKAKVTQSTAELNRTVKDIKTVVQETLDPLMLEFKLLNPTLYGEYLNARKVNHLAAGHAPKQTPQK